MNVFHTNYQFNEHRLYSLKNSLENLNIFGFQELLQRKCSFRARLHLNSHDKSHLIVLLAYTSTGAVITVNV